MVNLVYLLVIGGSMWLCDVVCMSFVTVDGLCMYNHDCIIIFIYRAMVLLSIQVVLCGCYFSWSRCNVGQTKSSRG